MSSFVSHLFGSIAGPYTLGLNPSVDFIPADSNGKIIDIKGHDATWLGMKNRLMQKYAYEYCFPVSSVVDRLAEYDITGVIEILRATGKGKENYATGEWAARMKKLIAQPNPLQNWEQFRGQQVIYKKIFGYCPVFPLVPAGFDPSYATAMINIPPWCFEAVPTRKFLYTSKAEELIDKYIVTINGTRFELKPNEIFILEDSFFQDDECGYLLPQSRLVGLDMAISNICAAMEADNVLLKKKGPLGFISADPGRDQAGPLPFDKGERDQLQQALQAYGLSLSQYQYVIAGFAAKWNAMSYDVKQLGTKETIILGEKSICHRFGFPYVLYEEVDATFANSSTAAKAVFNNNVIPNNKKDLNKYNKFFKSEENNAKIVGDFCDTPALQEDAKAKAEAAKAWNDALLIEYNNNLITRNQWLEARGYDKIADGDKYKKDEGTTAPPEPVTDPVIEDEPEEIEE